MVVKSVRVRQIANSVKGNALEKPYFRMVENGVVFGPMYRSEETCQRAIENAR